MNGKRNGRLPTLYRPLDAKFRGIDAVALSDFANDWVFGGGCVFRCAVALRAAGRADGTVADGLNAVIERKFKKLRLLKVRVQLHLIDRGLDARVAENHLEFGDGHVGGADVTHQPEVHKLLHLAPCLHEVRVDVWPGVGAARGDIAMRRMEVREGPVDEVEVEIIESKIGKRFAA